MRRLAWLLVCSCAALLACAVAFASDLPDLDATARARLASASEDASLQPWQREFMREAAGLRANATLDDGEWREITIGHTPERRYDASAAYDSLRDRLVLFGGYHNGNCADVWALSLSDPPTWTRLTTYNTPPAARHGHGAIVDTRLDRMIVFGGADDSGQFRNDVWTLSLTEPHFWKALAPTGTAPVGRYQHGMVYDSKRNRVLVFGGYSSSGARNDTWILSLGAAPAWTSFAIGAPLPPARYGHSTLYDRSRDRLVVYGGNSTGAMLADAWVLPLTAPNVWSQLSPTGTPPPSRMMHSATLDAAHDRMIVHGGYHDVNQFLDDTWALSFAGAPAWTNLAPATGTGARRSEAAIVDVVRGRLVTAGGMSQSEVLGDAWRLPLDGSTGWEQLVASPSLPEPRRDHAVALDPDGDRLWMYGGSAGATTGDVWKLSLAGFPEWVAIAPLGTAPDAYERHSMVFDPVRSRLLVFGGLGNSQPRNGVWALSTTGTPTWTALAPTGTPPAARSEHVALYDAVHDRMIVFGGLGAFGPLNDVWALSLGEPPAWTPLAPTGTPPAVRFGCAAIADPAHDRIVIMGGVGTSYYADAWQLTLGSTPEWTALSPAGAPPAARASHRAIYDPTRERMLVHGGTGGVGRFEDTWSLSLGGTTPAWTLLQPPGTHPSARYSHSFTWDASRDRAWMFGGFDGGFHADVWQFLPLAPLDGGAPATPRVSALRAVAPNPAAGASQVRFALARPGHVRLDVLDVSGRRVRTLLDGERLAGEGAATWDGADEAGRACGAGVYFVRLAAPGVQATRRIVRLK